MKKAAIWELLVRKGFFQDRKTAESWILMGKVLADGQRIDKPGHRVPITAGLIVKGIEQRYVSKGGLKLKGALDAFDMDVAGRVAVDAGASTGGFTDCLLQRGAKKVYAVDVGFGQLAGKLRIDPRVVNMERTNISDVDPNRLDPKPSLGTVDLSYLSLKKAIPIFAAILGGMGELLCLVKPLFKVEDSEIRRSGEIKDPGIFKEIPLDLVRYTKGLGYSVAGITHSPVTGNKGTREFFMRVNLDPSNPSVKALSEDAIYHQIEQAVADVMKIEEFKKSG
ncbi:MAG: TlyA family RNA methyltransferase [Clostridia bacterium]|jgi:23S rRNA (cytidine1920-2'-O)/16S rRNA (cytidine1409-2'-O)-methyltransferase